MKLTYGIDPNQHRIRIKTLSNSSTKQNRTPKSNNFQTIDKSSLQKLKVPQTFIRFINTPESTQKKLSLSKRLSAKSRKTTQKTKSNLLMVENFKKHDQLSIQTFSNQPSPQKKSQNSSRIINLLLSQKKYNNSVYEELQKRQTIINDSNNNLITNQFPFQSYIKATKPAQTNYDHYSKRIVPKIQRPFKILAIHFQFALGINEGINSIKKELSTQTFYQGIQDEFFFDEYAKYKLHKEKYENILIKKRQKIEQMVKQHTRFEKDYQNLINSVNHPPSDLRQKRVFNLAKDLDQAQKKVTKTFNKVYQMGNQMSQMIKKQTNKYFKKKNQLSNSIQNLSKALVLQLERQQNQNVSTKKKIRMLNRILSQYRYIEAFDNENRNQVEQIYTKYHDQISQSQLLFDQWKDLLYENRVLLYNFMKQIQKIPLIMTQIFGFGQFANGDILALDKCLKSSSNFMQCCQDCYTFKKNVKHLQVWNSQLKPIFKTIEWLLRDGDKKKQCIELI